MSQALWRNSGVNLDLPGSRWPGLGSRLSPKVHVSELGSGGFWDRGPCDHQWIYVLLGAGAWLQGEVPGGMACGVHAGPWPIPPSQTLPFCLLLGRQGVSMCPLPFHLDASVL